MTEPEERGRVQTYGLAEGVIAWSFRFRPPREGVKVDRP